MIIVSKKTKLLNYIRGAFQNRFIENIIIFLIRSKSIFSRIAEKLVPSNYLYPKNTCRDTKVNGLNLILDISDYVNHWVYFNLEDKGFDELIKLAENRRTILDIGANIGFTALSMSNVVDVYGKVHAFEPDPFNFNRLKENVRLNPNSKVILQNKGLGEKKEQLKLAIATPDNLGGNRINDLAIKDYTLVNITTIDLYCEEHNIKDIDLLKIDVEGFEYNVLKGANNLISHSKPILFIELDDNNLRQQQTTANELLTFLESYYNNIYIANNLTQINSKNDFANCHFDIIAINEN